MMSKHVYDKMEENIETYDVVEVFSFDKKTIKERILVLTITKPPKLIYGKLKTKIGLPEDYSDNLKDKVFDNDCAKEKTAIPKTVIQKKAMQNGEEGDQLDAAMGQKDKVLDLLMKLPKEERLEKLTNFQNYVKEQSDGYEQASKAKNQSKQIRGPPSGPCPT